MQKVMIVQLTSKVEHRSNFDGVCSTLNNFHIGFKRLIIEKRCDCATSLNDNRETPLQKKRTIKVLYPLKYPEEC